MYVNSTPSDVTWFSSEQLGAPILMTNGTDDLLKVLDACLVTGYGNVATPMYVTADNGIITFQYGVNHNLAINQNIVVSGATDPLLNGVHKITSALNNTLQITLAGVTDTSGVIKTRIAALGWESIFGNETAGKRAYRSKSATSSRRVLYLESYRPSQTAANTFKMSICEDMTTLGSQIGSITDTTNNAYSGGAFFWYQGRGAAAGSTIPNVPIAWKVIGNSDFFLLLLNWNTNTNFVGTGIQDIFGFGEFIPLADDGADTTFLMTMYDPGLNNAYTQDSKGLAAGRFGTYDGCTCWTMGSTGSLVQRRISPFAAMTTSSSYLSGKAIAPYPSAKGDYLFANTCRILADDGGAMGYMPSLLFIEHSMLGSFDGNVIDGVLIAKVNTSITASVVLGNVGFYVGG